MNAGIDESEWHLCENVEELITFLQEQVEDKESSVRISAVLGLLLVSLLSSEDYYEKLVTYMKSLLILDDIYVRGSAALCIGVLGTRLEDPVPFIDLLKLLLFDEARFVKRNASVGLAVIASSTAPRERRNQLIEELFSSSYWYFRIGGALSLGFHSEDTDLAAIIKTLKPLLNDSDIDVRISAVYALGFIAKKYGFIEELMPYFEKCLYDYDAAVIQSAKVVLNLITFPTEDEDYPNL
ncbi:MAG: hypothetical protein HWN65_20265 [Candidatus Helarchaeota archaeon]|nr:hypothetical protein [Candidatus Helarchaeota archaeon]